MSDLPSHSGLCKRTVRTQLHSSEDRQQETRVITVLELGTYHLLWSSSQVGCNVLQPLWSCTLSLVLGRTLAVGQLACCTHP